MDQISPCVRHFAIGKFLGHILKAKVMCSCHKMSISQINKLWKCVALSRWFGQLFRFPRNSDKRAVKKYRIYRQLSLFTHPCLGVLNFSFCCCFYFSVQKPSLHEKCMQTRRQRPACMRDLSVKKSRVEVESRKREKEKKVVSMSIR